MIAALLAAVSLKAQRLEFGGAVLNHDLMWTTDMASLSQQQVFGTARAMGMGGAFVSLGADLTSMALNPAGLGMYRRSEVSFTPYLSVGKSETAGTQPWLKNGKTRFSFSNVGGAFNIVENATGTLTSLTLGIGMNRIADFNSRTSFSSESRFDASAPGHLMPTIADIFAQQLYTFGVYPRPAAGGGPNGPIDMGEWNPNVWPAILGYDACMVDNNGTADEPYWQPARIGANASVLHSLETIGSGSVNEFDISVGLNLNNIVYLGATLGIQSVRRKLETVYQEEYGYFDGAPASSSGMLLDEQLLRATFRQRTVVDGSGANFKLGAVIRPVEGLRLGVAFHTPTWYGLDRTYRADIEADIEQRSTGMRTTVANSSPESVADEGNDWNFISPARLMFGASYTFGSFAIVSVDYQREWYNGMRVRRQPDFTGFANDFYDDEFRNHFRGTNTVRVGAEVRPLPVFALRAGGGYTDSMLRDDDFYVDDAYTSQPVAIESWYVTAGAGVNLSRSITLDVAYRYGRERMSQYQLFFSRPDTGEGFETYSGWYDTRFRRHFVTMTFGFRF